MIKEKSSSFKNYMWHLWFVLFVMLKVVGASDWSWWWLLLPMVPDLAWAFTKAGLL